MKKILSLIIVITGILTFRANAGSCYNLSDAQATAFKNCKETSNKLEKNCCTDNGGTWSDK